MPTYYVGANLYSSNYLAHYGIKGMKWGIRRYQNEDGSLTSAGKNRYGYNLDINDRSRQNIAKIRLGEARRRLDVAKRNNPQNKYRVAELQGRVRLAKKAVKTSKRIDKGAARAAKGETIMGNKRKAFIVYGASVLGSKAFTAFLNYRMKDLASQGRWTQKHQMVAELLNNYATVTMASLSTAYSIKKTVDNFNLRAYNAARLSGQRSIKSTGSQEYADRVKALKNKNV